MGKEKININYFSFYYLSKKEEKINIFQYAPLGHEDKLLSLSGVKNPGLLGNWFWQVRLVARRSLISSENCCAVCYACCKS